MKVSSGQLKDSSKIVLVKIRNRCLLLELLSELKLYYWNGRLTSRIDIALGPGSTGVWLAGVWLGGAPVGSADVAHAAVGVYHALWLAAGDGVGGRGEAGHTATLGVTIPVTSKENQREGETGFSTKMVPLQRSLCMRLLGT